MSQLSLMDELAVRDRVLDAFERAHGPFLYRLRRLAAELYRRERRAITADDVRAEMERLGIDFPEGVSPNVMGALFRTEAWHRSETRVPSRRDGSHGNPIFAWRHEP